MTGKQLRQGTRSFTAFMQQENIPLPAPATGSAMPVLFLDIDGVLNEFGSQPEGGMLGLQADKVARLKRVLYHAPCDIVLSSTWRIIGRNLAKVEAMLEDMCVAPLYGITPTAGKTEGGVFYRALPRAEEIKEWLKSNPARTRFVVLDDDVPPHEFPPENLVITNGYEGALTEALADELIRKLNTEADRP